MCRLTRLRPVKTVFFLLLITLLLSVQACTTYEILNTAAISESNFKQHAQTKQDKHLTVTAAILTSQEAIDVFGLPIKLVGMQAIWIEVENRDKHPYWLLYPALDPDYFSPDEVAYAFRGAMSDENLNTTMQQLRKLSFNNPVHPGEKKSGFVFVNLDEDSKQVEIELLGHQKLTTFSFFFSVHSLNYLSLFDIENSHHEEKLDVDEKMLKQALEQLPCCTTSEDGKKQGDPLNLVLIGNAEGLFKAFVRRGWHPAEKNYLESARRTIYSFLLGSHYRYSPVSPLYAFGRKQDVALQKARGTIHQRQHLRLWLTPYLYQGKGVWIGQVSRDIGVRFTRQSAFLVTHKIDPDIDEARNELIQEMLFSRGLQKIGYVRGIPASTPESPAYNLTGDPYFNDGLRAVLLLSARPVQLTDVRFFNWIYSTRPGARHLSDSYNNEKQ